MKTKYILSTLLLVCLFSFSSLLLGSDIRVKDSANLLTSDEVSKLETKLQTFLDTYNMEAVIHTTTDIGDKTPKDYAIDYFNSNNYGCGNSRSGIILMINIEARKFNISSIGDTKSYLNPARQESIKAGITPYLSDKNYYKAFETFIDQTAHYIESGLPNGNAVGFSDGKKLFTDKYNQPLTLSDYLIYAGIATIVASLISFTTKYFIARSYKNPKHVTPVAFPDSNSVNYTEVRDILVSSYTTRTRIERPSDNNGSGCDNSDDGSIDGEF